MKTRHSNHLDYARFVAAVAVVLDHLSSRPYTHRVIPHYPTRFGQIGVALFFVLSGYVIAYVTSNREKDWSSYASARVSRLYSVVPLALLVTFVADSIGKSLVPRFYAMRKVLAKPPSVEGYLSTLFFQNEWQIWHFRGIAAGTNNPLWSLSYEATYYAIIGLLIFAPKRFSIPACLGLFVLSGPTFVAMFPIWVAGFGLYHLQKRLRIPGWFGWTLLGVGVVGLALTPLLLTKAPRTIPGFKFPFGRLQGNRNLPQDVVACVFTSLFILGSSSLPERLETRFGSLLDKVAKFLGNLTFPLYAFHYPILVLAAALSPFPNKSKTHVFFVAFMIFSTVLALVPLTDISKDFLRRTLRRKIPKPST